MYQQGLRAVMFWSRARCARRAATRAAGFERSGGDARVLRCRMDLNADTDVAGHNPDEDITTRSTPPARADAHRRGAPTVISAG